MLLRRWYGEDGMADYVDLDGVRTWYTRMAMAIRSFCCTAD